MSLASHERGRTARNLTALTAAGGLLSLMMGLANNLGAEGYENNLGTQRIYAAKYTNEVDALQRQYAQVPQEYTSNGRKVVQTVAFTASYPQIYESPLELQSAQTRTERRANRWYKSSGLLAIITGAGALIARRQRKNEEQQQALRAVLAADTQMLPYVRSGRLDQPEAVIITSPYQTPAVYGRPTQPSLQERRAAQLAAPTNYDPFSVTYNYMDTSLTPLAAPTPAAV